MYGAEVSPTLISSVTDAVMEDVKQWQSRPLDAVYPVIYWSQETVEIGGIEQIIKAAHFRLAFSRKMFVIAYPREVQEMVMGAHSKAFIFYGGVPLQMVYDNPKTIVDSIPPTPPPTSTMLQYPPVQAVAIHRFGC